MADPVSCVESILTNGKGICDRVNTVTSFNMFKKSSEQLRDRLETAMKIVKETANKLQFIDIFKKLDDSILKADKFTIEFVDMGFLKTVTQAIYIKGRFESLNNDLSCFQTDMDIALQKNAVEERKEIFNMLKELKDSREKYISTANDDFVTAQTELEEKRKQIQQGM